MDKATIHQMPVATKAVPIFKVVFLTSCQVADLSRADQISHINGPRPTKRRELALTPPIVSVINPKRAGCLQPGVRNERTVIAINQGSPAHGRSITEWRSM